MGSNDLTYKGGGTEGHDEAKTMSATVPFIAFAALIALSLSARQAALVTVKASRQYATATLAFGVLTSFWILS